MDGHSEHDRGDHREGDRRDLTRHGLIIGRAFQKLERPWETAHMSAYSLSGKVALVTGGARGIGFATAKELVARGAKVIVLDLHEDAVQQAAAQLGGDALGVAADVTDREAMGDVVATAVERFGGLDVIVANAGIASQGVTALAAQEDQFERVIEVNLLGVWRSVRAALPEIARRQGHVVVVSSIYAFVNGVGAAPYAMAKAGVEQLGRALRVELRPHGASASVAYFGYIDTEMVHQSIDADPLFDRMMAASPKILQKRLPPSAAGKAIVRGIERRQTRIIRPRRWTVLSVLRGILNRMERDEESQAITRELDARAGRREPLTAEAEETYQVSTNR
jgi:NAD(P)-dependent dehydrogenase (short-subunit alcohol dehydrogenase family)